MLWIKTLHIVLITSWFGGLFYLPRIFVNLADETDAAALARLLRMADKLYRFMTILAVLALGFVSTGLGYILYFRLVRSLGSIGVTAQSYLRAPIGVLLASLLLGESVTFAMLAGMALVVVGVMAMTMRQRPPVASAAETTRN